MKDLYIYILKMVETLWQIQIKDLDSKVPMFSSLNISSRHVHLESAMEDTI